MSQDIDTKSNVRMPLNQFWTIIAAVGGGTFVISAGLYTIKADQAKLRADFAQYQERTENQVQATLSAWREIKADRADSLKEWTQWRFRVDQTNTQQDGEIRNLQRARDRSGG